MQQFRKFVQKWIPATLSTSLVALPVAAAVRTEAQNVQGQIVASLYLFAVLMALQMLRPMRELRHLHVLYASADAPELRQDELQRIRRDVHTLVAQPVREQALLTPRRRSTDRTDS